MEEDGSLVEELQEWVLNALLCPEDWMCVTFGLGRDKCRLSSSSGGGFLRAHRTNPGVTGSVFLEAAPARRGSEGTC